MIIVENKHIKQAVSLPENDDLRVFQKIGFFHFFFGFSCPVIF